jgi:two-component system LytT family response regulator
MSTESSSIIRTLVVDDERLGRDLIKFLLQNHPTFEIVEECSNGHDALEAIEKHRPDLVFLDIQMPGINGIEVAARISKDHRPFIVFVTAYNQYAIEAFEKNAVDYLVKPVDEDRFESMMQRVKERIRLKQDAGMFEQLKRIFDQGEAASPTPAQVTSQSSEKFVVKHDGKVSFLKMREIEYFEAAGNYVEIHTAHSQHIIYDSLSKLESRLDTEKFLRIHRSTIVNVDKINELEPYFNGEFIVKLHCGKKLKISRTYSQAAKTRLGMD